MPVFEFEVRRHAGDEFDERLVEQRYARFQAVRHAHPVLHMKERWQQALEVEMCHAVEIGFLVDVALTIENTLEG